MSDMTVAKTILAQLGGNKFAMMTGAKNFVGGDKSLMFSIGGGAKNKINKVRVTLTDADLYDIEFMKFSPKKLTCDVVSKAEGIYNDMLCEVFTTHTGFYTSL